MATGDYIMWLNSDDILFPSSISTAVDFFESHSSTVLLHGHSELFSEHGRNHIVGTDPGDFKLRYPAYIPFPQPSSFFRASLLSDKKFLDETLHYGMDFELLVRAYLTGYDISYKPFLFSGYRLHSSSKTNNSRSFVLDWREVFTRFLNSFPEFNFWHTSLLEAGLISSTKKSYQTSVEISEHDFLQILSYHLSTCAHMLYKCGSRHEVNSYLHFIETYLPTSYSRMSLNLLQLKNRFLPKFLRHFLSYR